MSSKNELRDFLFFTRKIAKKAGQILLNERNKVKIVRQKDIQDFTTSADILSERFIIDSIEKKYPEHGILSEEKGEIKKESDYRWVIDPLDGTKEFTRGIPLFNVSIALEFKCELIVSSVYRPMDNSLYSAAKKVGSFLGNEKIKVSEVNSLDKSFIYCYLPSYHRQKEKYDWAFKILEEIGKRVYRLRSLSDENTALCWLAHGGIEAYINLSNPPKWHDIAPGLLVAQEAEALITDSKGNSFSKNHFDGIVASSSKIHDQILDILK